MKRTDALSLSRCNRRDDGLLLRKDQTHLPDISRILRVLVKNRVLRRLHAGTYVETEKYDALLPWHRYDLQARALGVSSGRILGGYSAAAAWGLWRYEPTPSQHEVYRPGGGRKPQPARVTQLFHRLPAAEVTGTTMRATTVLRTLVDLTRLHGFGAGFVAACSALRQGLVTREQLASYDVTGMEGLAHWSLVVEKATGEVESALEAVFLAQSVFYGGFALIPQVPVRGKNGRNYAVDFRVEGTDIYVETDGRGKYGASISEQEFSLKKEKERADNLPVSPERFGYDAVMSGKAYRTVLRLAGRVNQVLPRIHW